MHVIGGLLGLGLILVVLVDGFESILQPRRVTRRFRWARVFYQYTWSLWRMAANHIRAGRRQTSFLSVFGPLSLIGLFVTWVIGLIVGFGLIDWAIGAPIHYADGPATVMTYLYLSGTTFFTLGYGDVTPAGPLGRFLAVGESGLGFGFLAAILSYLPVLFQSFSRRELMIALLDARAGSPPTASELLLRMARAKNLPAIDPFLGEWERWAADLLEGQLSFPVLGFYRSQHDNESWLAALTVVLDTCSILLTQVKDARTYQAQVTFAIARHAAVDLSLVMHTPSQPPGPDRLTSLQLQQLRDLLQQAGLELNDMAIAEPSLRKLRGTYEPFIEALAARLILTLPPMLFPEVKPDNWQRSAWMRPVPGIGNLSRLTGDEEHFA